MDKRNLIDEVVYWCRVNYINYYDVHSALRRQ
jgi:hypothetical protein